MTQPIDRPRCKRPVIRQGVSEECGHPIVDEDRCGYHLRSLRRSQARQAQQQRAADLISTAGQLANELTKAGFPAHNYGAEISMNVDTATALVARLGSR